MSARSCCQPSTIFKQKTAYEIMSGDWSSDVCSSDLGQGNTVVSPIQLATYAATLANNGTRYRTHFVKAILDTNTCLLYTSRCV